MKIFFSVELSEDIPKEYIFQIASTNDTLAEEYEQASRAIDIIKSKAKLPAGLHILRFVLYYFLILVFMCIFMVLGNFVSALKALIFLPIYLGGIITGLYFIRRYEKNRKERTENSNELRQAYKKLAEITEKIYISHGAPKDCAKADILTVCCKTKTDRNGNEKQIITDRHNILMGVFTEADSFCLVTPYSKFAISLKFLQRISTIDEQFPINNWEREISKEDDYFKSHGLRTDSHGASYAERYHILEFSHNDEEWGLFFPCYELPVFEELTGLKAEN